MITIDLKAKPRVKRWLKDNRISFNTLQKTAHIFFNQIQKRSKSNKHYNLEVKISPQSSSGYYFGFDELHVTHRLNQNGWSGDKKFEHNGHEKMIATLQNVPELRKINYQNMVEKYDWSNMVKIYDGELIKLQY